MHLREGKIDIQHFIKWTDPANINNFAGIKPKNHISMIFKVLILKALILKSMRLVAAVLLLRMINTNVVSVNTVGSN